jgi:hypothetical protein
LPSAGITSSMGYQAADYQNVAVFFHKNILNFFKSGD